jgi:glycosyltransferase involved in cell wall biosynthesis
MKILSIIIPSFNSESYIEHTLQSIAEQRDDKLEIILVDGGSTDKTLEICEHYRKIFDHFISEPDKGQSDAFNKGFNLASGRYVTWLNSDDILCRGAIAGVLPRLEKGGARWFTANTVYLDASGAVTRTIRNANFDSLAYRCGYLNFGGPSTFVAKELFLEEGPFNVDLHYCMDVEYWWRLARRGERYRRIPVYFWALRLHADAKTASVLTSGVTPPKMRVEADYVVKTLQPSLSPFVRSAGVHFARLRRLLNLNYLKSFVDFRFRRHILTGADQGQKAS